MRLKKNEKAGAKMAWVSPQYSVASEGIRFFSGALLLNFTGDSLVRKIEMCWHSAITKAFPLYVADSYLDAS